MTEYDDQEDQRRLLRDSAATFCARTASVERLRPLQESAAGFDPAIWRQMAELGWAALLIPEARGGLGASLADVAAIAEELGKVAAPEPLIETATLAATVLSQADESALADSLLGQIAAGEATPAVAWQPEQRTRLQAVRAQSGFMLDGELANVPCAANAEGFVVPAQLDGELALFWIARDAAGLSIATSKAADGTVCGSLALRKARVPGEALLLRGARAASALDDATSAAYVIAAACLVGVMERTLEMTLEYMRSRVQFGRPIGSFQALQHRAVDLYIRKEVARAVVDEATASFEAADAGKRMLRALRAKHRATDSALLVAREAIQFHGAIGFTLENDLVHFVNRALVLAAQYGNAARLRQAFAAASPYVAAQDTADPAARAVSEPDGGDYNALDDEDFRMLVRRFFEEKYPEDKRFPSRKLRWSEIRDWYMTVSRRGWLAPNWPREYGGMGLGASKCIVFMEEQERWGVARTPADLGLTMVGPMLIHHGTEAQRRKYLPKILAGEHVWCQGYSEPNAGSDLASLRTTAVLDGDEFVVNGQKTWTTMATDANYMFLLARTDKDASKQAGISFLLLDFATPGIKVRPIRNLAGNEEFCEVFFDDVRVPRENLVGELHQGWTIAKSLLTFERLFLGSPKQSQYVLQRLAEFASERGLMDDPAFLDRFTRLRLDVHDLESTYARFAEQVKKGQLLGPDISMLKIWGTETCARLSELMVEAADLDGATPGPLGRCGVDVLNQYYYSRAGTIYGGSNEIQRNILAKQVLRLP